MQLIMDQVNVSINQQSLLRNINLQIPTQQITGIIGPNGSGKSTLLRTLMNELPVSSGGVLYHDVPIQQLTQKQLSQKMSFLFQKNDEVADFTVYEMLMMGRYPWKSWLSRINHQDKAIVNEQIKKFQLTELIDQPFSKLSGGEQQRVLIARALVQQAEIILLDEPLNHLDIYFQIELLKQLRRYCPTIIMVVHDLNIANAYCDQLICLKAGAVVAQGAPATVLTEPLIREVFNLSVTINKNGEQSVMDLYQSLKENTYEAITKKDATYQHSKYRSKLRLSQS